MKKIACIECGVEILVSTAEKTDGKCMPCHKGIRRQIETEKQAKELREERLKSFYNAHPHGAQRLKKKAENILTRQRSGGLPWVPDIDNLATAFRNRGKIPVSLTDAFAFEGMWLTHWQPADILPTIPVIPLFEKDEHTIIHTGEWKGLSKYFKIIRPKIGIHQEFFSLFKRAARFNLIVFYDPFEDQNSPLVNILENTATKYQKMIEKPSYKEECLTFYCNNVFGGDIFRIEIDSNWNVNARFVGKGYAFEYR